jgi:hypothetical protein
MSERTDLLSHLKARLNTALANNLESPSSTVLHGLLTDMGNHPEEHLPDLPHSPKLQLAVQALNDSIVPGLWIRTSDAGF